MTNELCTILFCDFDGDFKFAATLSKIGYSVDQIRPDSLRQVSVGDHKAYIFAFESENSMKKAMKTTEKLKAAELKTPIILLNYGKPDAEFIHHQSSPYRADAYVANVTETRILDVLDSYVGCPVPPALKSSLQLLAEDKELRQNAESLRKQVDELEGELQIARSKPGVSSESLDKALEAQRNYYKPKLQALLKGQKIQIQTETERLKVALSEVEAKLLDREMRIKELEGIKEKTRIKIEELTNSHEKAQQKLREFYQNKLRALEGDKGPDDSQKSNAG